jgi:hypothetical protein
MMTEQKTETANYGALVWQKARLVLRMASSVTDWPNAFTPTELAKLQYPESAGREKRITRDNRKALEVALKADIQAGRIGITLKSQAPITGISGVYLARWGGRSSLQAEMEACEVTAIERSPFRAWLSANKQEPSEHIRAWLGDVVQPAQSPESASSQAEAPSTNKPRPPVKTAGNRDRMAGAIVAGINTYKAKHKTEPTADSLFDWLREHDETDTIDDSDDEILWWKKGNGNLKPITRKALANRLTGIKAKNPG